MANVGLLLIRVVMGLTLAGHGTQKLFGWFGGHGVKGTGGWLESIGLKPGVALAIFAGLAELIGGLLFAIGLWLPVAAALVIIVMLGAIFSVHLKNGYWVDKGGIEYPFILLVLALALAFIGPGTYVLF
jgi:putative oxidoreductase